MQDKIEKAISEVNGNFAYFREKLPEILQSHNNKFALLHHREITDFFDSENDAIKVGMKNYGEGCFSVQKVTDVRVDLGFQSYVVL